MQAIQSLGSLLRLFAYFTLAGATSTFFITVLGNQPLETYTSIWKLQHTPGLFYTLAWSDMLGKMVGFIILPIIYLAFSKQKNASPFKQDKEITFSGINILLGIAALVLSLPTITIIADFNKNFHFPESLKNIETIINRSEALAEATLALFINVQSFPDLCLSIFALAVMPAIGEEIIFRGFFQRELIQQTKTIHLSVWITACIFSFIHFQFLGFFPRMLLGALLGYMYVWSGSLLVPILMHFTNNALTLILLVAYKKEYSSFDPESSTQIPYIIVAISFLLCVGILYNRKKTYDIQLSAYIKKTHE